LIGSGLRRFGRREAAARAGFRFGAAGGAADEVLAGVALTP
jgi:hypothetical protein